MQQNNFFNQEGHHMQYVQMPKPRKKYGFMKFCCDAFMTTVTGGLWIIWIFVREMRNR